MSRGISALPAAIVLLATGCVSLAPQAKKIRVTSNGADVAQCKILGVVESHPPYILPNDGVNQLRNNAAALDADTLLANSSPPFSCKSGIAYRCGK